MQRAKGLKPLHQRIVIFNATKKKDKEGLELAQVPGQKQKPSV